MVPPHAFTLFPLGLLFFALPEKAMFNDQAWLCFQVSFKENKGFALSKTLQKVLDY